MTPQQIRAAIAASPELQALAAARNDAAIAEALSAGRTRLRSHIITERGVRQYLSIVDGAAFLKLLRDVNQATTAPAWLTAVLNALGVPSEQQWAYFDTLQCGWAWLRAEGIDLGASQVQSMLDLIAAGNNSLASACASLKALGTEPDPVHVNDVSAVLNADNVGNTGG